MPTILYAVIASADKVPLAEANASNSKHVANAEKVLANIKGAILERKCLVYNGYAFDMMPNRDGTIYLCVTEESCNRAVSFKFLESAMRRCKVHRENHADFAEELRKELEFFNNSQNTKIREIRSEIEDIKDEMIRNVDKLMDRGDRLDTLLLKSNELEGETQLFRHNAQKIRRRLLCKRILMYSTLAIILLAAVFVIILFSCSKDGTNFDRCRPS